MKEDWKCMTKGQEKEARESTRFWCCKEAHNNLGLKSETGRDKERGTLSFADVQPFDYPKGPVL
jgi:hypothetical protein